MAFIERGSLNPHGAPVLRSEIITDDLVTTELDSVKITSGFIDLGSTSALVFGHVKAIVTNDGVGVDTTGASGASSGSYVGTFTASATNETVAKVRATCDVSKFTLYGAELDAAIGSGNSDLLGQYMDLVDEDTLSESSVSTSSEQYHSWGIDPSDSAKALVNIYESGVFGL